MRPRKQNKWFVYFLQRSSIFDRTQFSLTKILSLFCSHVMVWTLEYLIDEIISERTALSSKSTLGILLLSPTVVPNWSENHRAISQLIYVFPCIVPAFLDLRKGSTKTLASGCRAFSKPLTYLFLHAVRRAYDAAHFQKLPITTTTTILALII